MKYTIFEIPATPPTEPKEEDAEADKRESELLDEDNYTK